MTPRDIVRFKFTQATSTSEIVELFSEAMNENVFDGYDVGEPLYLALERLHLDTALGEEHLGKCFDTINQWEAHCGNGRMANDLYYHVILKLYTDASTLSENPSLDSSGATEAVWKIFEQMSEKGVEDHSGIAWWETLRLAVMNRESWGALHKQYHGNADKNKGKKK